MSERYKLLREKYMSLKRTSCRSLRVNDNLLKAIQSINDQYKLGLNFENGMKFARKLYDYHNLKHHIQIADTFPLRYFEIYEWSKTIIKEWSMLDVKKAIREYAGFYKLRIQKTCNPLNVKTKIYVMRQKLNFLLITY